MREKFTESPSVPIDDIKLDLFNFRYYGQLRNQRECIEAMLKDKNSGIYNLAKDIAEYGLTPDPIILSKNEENDWVVREGNRRITALKLLNNPSIIKDPALKKKFDTIAKIHGNNIPSSIACLACNDEECILDYIDRLHSGLRNGTGRRQWDAENKTYFDMHRGLPGANALAMKVKEMVTNEGVTINEPYSITNLQRVLQNKDVQSKLRFSWDNGKIIAAVDEKKLMDIFKEIVTQTGKKKVREIYSGDQQSEFIDKIVNDLGIKIEDIKTNTYVVGDDKQGNTTTPKPLRTTIGRIPPKPSWDRKRLIDSRRTYLRIPDIPENTKVRNILLS